MLWLAFRGRGVRKEVPRVSTPSSSDQQRGPSSLGAAISLGTQMTAGVAVFAGLGYWLDQRRGGGSAFTLAGIFAGLAYGAYEVWKLVRRLNEEDRQEQARRRNSPP